VKLKKPEIQSLEFVYFSVSTTGMLTVRKPSIYACSPIGSLFLNVYASMSTSSTSKDDADDKKSLIRGFETICLHSGYTPDATTSRGVPLYRTAPYSFKSTEHAARLFALKELGNIYTRMMNPTTDILEKRFAAMEGAPAALALASGTAAVFYAIINLAEQGDNFVSARNLYGGTYTQFNDILPKFGISAKFVDICNLEAVKSAIDDKTRAIFCETVSNPALEISPLEELATVANEAGIPLIVDDTFTTPYLLKPIDYGAHIICHSLTKWTGGHGTGIGGIVVDAGTFPWKAGKHPLYTEPDTSYGGLRWGLDLPENLAPIAYILRMLTVPLRNLGSPISPDNSWMFLQGIETLALRMERHCENALKVAQFLQDRPEVDWVKYPGLPGDKEYEKNKKYLKGKGGSLVVFEVKGGAAKGRKFIDSLKLFSHVANVGDAKSLAINPATTTHSQMNETEQRLCGITPGLIRLSVGIETIDDILADLDQALRK
jgi:O-acetylhomoserine (thiol)-lyase